MIQPTYELTDLTEALITTGTYERCMDEFKELAGRGPQHGFVVRKSASTRRAESIARKKSGRGR